MSTDSFTYRDLEAWQFGMKLVERCYRITADFPKSELYGLTSQIRRAAVSIPSNVAEGHSRKSTAVFANHVDIALGSHAEVETCLELAERLGFLAAAAKKEALTTCDSAGRLLNRLHQSLELKLLQQKSERVPPVE